MKKKENHVSPRGEAVWPKLSEPNTQFNPDGVYETDLRLGAEEGQKFLSKLEDMLDEHYDNVCKEQGKKVKRGSISCKPVEVDGTATGELDFKFKMKALAGREGKKWEQRPTIMDTKGKVIDPKSVSIGSGSTIKVSFTIYPYYTAMVGAGLSLQMNAVQLIEYVPYGGSDMRSLGFEEEEGFVYTQETEEAQEDTVADNGDF